MKSVFSTKRQKKNSTHKGRRDGNEYGTEGALREGGEEVTNFRVTKVYWTEVPRKRLKTLVCTKEKENLTEILPLI